MKRYKYCRNCGKRIYPYFDGYTHMTLTGKRYIGCKNGQGKAAPR